eukprot:scaffold36043_cov58-Phaeocystis_antarctica.AAC.2
MTYRRPSAMRVTSNTSPNEPCPSFRPQTKSARAIVEGQLNPVAVASAGLAELTRQQPSAFGGNRVVGLCLPPRLPLCDSAGARGAELAPQLCAI